MLGVVLSLMGWGGSVDRAAETDGVPSCSNNAVHLASNATPQKYLQPNLAVLEPRNAHGLRELLCYFDDEARQVRQIFGQFGLCAREQRVQVGVSAKLCGHGP